VSVLIEAEAAIKDFASDSAFKLIHKGKFANIKVEWYDGYTSNSFELLMQMTKNKFPHTIYIGDDDISCSCQGFNGTLKRSKLCSHLAYGVLYLFEHNLVTLNDISLFMKEWKERMSNDNNTTTTDN
jgi:hypothetical protein